MGKDAKKENNLRRQILDKRSNIYTNQILMSIGEFINLYEETNEKGEREINISPDFQRMFRWSEEQESRFIESILLGYPIPAIFIIQREDGIWDVIDGVQRLSTIYHFVGILRDKKNKLVKPLTLLEGGLLKEQEGYVWSEKFGEKHLDSATRIDFKRSSLSVIMLRHGSDEDSKYELFKRINTGGSHLSSQEIRNALILMQNEEIFRLIDDYAKNNKFKSVINISEDRLSESMDKEILTRYLVAKNYDKLNLNLKHNSDLNLFMDNAIEKVCKFISVKEINKQLEEFIYLIHLIYDISDDYGFRVYDGNKYKGAFQWFIFEAVVWGTLIENNVYDFDKNTLEEQLQSLVGTGKYFNRTVRSSERFVKSRVYAKEVFKVAK